MTSDKNELTIPLLKSRFDALMLSWHRVIVGQDEVLRKILIAMLSGGHVLIEGVPGLAKTLIVTTLSKLIGSDFKRIQFTPDLLPGDLTGTEIYNPSSGEFSIRKGPIFTNVLLADEINRAPAKVQSALLEAMQEHQVTIGGRAMEVPGLFFTLATQNPIEQEGTFPLPEAQIDRFMLKLRISYPDRREESDIVDRMAFSTRRESLEPVITADQIIRMRSLVDKVTIDPKVKNYILDIVRATREKEIKGFGFGHLVDWGASPRASIYLALAARASAALAGRDFVLPDDVRLIAHDVLRHRIILSFEAEAENLTAQYIIEEILNRTEVP